ncbi:MAG: zinc-binding dehydrogenase [Nitrososphaerota archaeon]|nr:zinc-binding dehydrogenase [Candidatus Bathyarchaeota archaeon]MDW8048174.1 zinc-binding dehydrogenase [Nitrososphaerota archaeon]
MRIVAKEFPLIKPFTFSVRERLIEGVPDGFLLLKPVVAGICGSELLYFRGEKEEWKLRERLPMCLLHEGVAEIIHNPAGTGELQPGTFVVVNPLIPCGRCSSCLTLGENYCQNAKFMGSTADGLARSHLLYPNGRVIPVPEDVELELAALTEPLSVALNAYQIASIKPGERVCVIGDGPIGYLVALISSHVGRVSRDRLFVMGVVDEKLDLAEDFALTVNTACDDTERFNGFFDVVFEAVGGRVHRLTLREAICFAKAGGRCVLLGLSHGEVPVDINQVVNRGLSIMGSVRSRMEHYRTVLDLMRDEEFGGRVKRIISERRFTIRSAEDLYAAFRYADTEEGEAKTKPGRVLVYLAICD